MPTPFPFCSRLAAVALLLPCVALSTPASSHDASKHSGTNLSRLGKVEFKVECTPLCSRTSTGPWRFTIRSPGTMR